jgi:hypothetical protein
LFGLQVATIKVHKFLIGAGAFLELVPRCGMTYANRMDTLDRHEIAASPLVRELHESARTGGGKVDRKLDDAHG